MRLLPLQCIAALWLIVILAGCQTSLPVVMEPFDDPADAPRSEIPVIHPEGTCSLCDLYYAARQAVIRIEAGRALGAGVIIDDRGYAVTNAHVVAESTVVVVTTSAGASTAGRVAYADPELDLAIVALAPIDVSWSSMMLHDGAAPRIGSDVYVIGHPVGLGWSVSRGIISGYREAGELSTSPLIQTDAAISPGNSGGPLVNSDGHIVGIVVSKLAGGRTENVAFGIPVSIVRKFVAEHIPSSAEAREGSGHVAK